MSVWKKHFMNCLFPGKFISFSRNNFRYSRFFQVFGFSSLFSRFSRYLLHIPGFSRFFQDFPGAGHPVFMETWTPVFTSRIPISAKLILIFRYLGSNLYPFASEASPMLYENACYFWRPEPPFLLSESLFMRR